MKIAQQIVFLALIPAFLAGQVKYGGELFELPGDARNMAMADAGTVGHTGVSVGFYNPALAAFSTGSTMLIAHREQFAGVVQADMLAVNLPSNGKYRALLGLVRRSVDNIPDTRKALDDRNGNGRLDDDERLILDRISFFQQSEYGLLLTVAPLHQERWIWGMNTKLLNNSLAGESGIGIGFDLGIYRAFPIGFELGVMLQDITSTQIFWSTDFRETIPPRITAAGGWSGTVPIINRQILLVAEGTTRIDGEREQRAVQLGPLSLLSKFGFEAQVSPNFRFRLGTGTLIPFSTGAGLSFAVFDLDYAYMTHNSESALEPTHQISLILNLTAFGEFITGDTQ